MPIVVLLLVGLVCLAVGLFLSSTTWLIISLVASALAAFAGPANHERRRRADLARNAAAPTAQAPPVPAVDVWVVDGRPRYHREGCDIIGEQSAEAIPLSQATEDGFIPCSLCEPVRVDATKGA